MAAGKLPSPVSVTDMYVAALIEEQQETNKLLAALLLANATPAPDDSGVGLSGRLAAAVVTADELAPTLPADFPGRQKLIDAGFLHAKDLPRTSSAIRKIKGIGEATSFKILERLAKPTPKG